MGDLNQSIIGGSPEDRVHQGYFDDDKLLAVENDSVAAVVRMLDEEENTSREKLLHGPGEGKTETCESCPKRCQIVG